MKLNDLAKALTGEVELPIYVEVEDDSYAEVIGVSKLKGGPFRVSKALILHISDPVED
jgi:hypothetical protein